MGFKGKRVSEGFSEAVLRREVSGRCSERPVGEYDPLGVCPILFLRELRNIYRHHPESKERKYSEGNSGFIHPMVGADIQEETGETISATAILWLRPGWPATMWETGP